MNCLQRTALGVFCAFSTFACVTPATDGERFASTEASTSFEDFEKTVFREPSGAYIVNGDTQIENRKKLEEFFWSLHSEGSLIVNRSNGHDTAWNDTQKMNLSYCISDRFGTHKAAVLQAMADAGAAWSAAAQVRFVYIPAQDATCTAQNSNVVFDVNPVNVGGQYVARSFFPDDSRGSRNVLIDNSAFSSSGSPSLTGVLRHELGHTLGFRHEHTRPEAGACFEDTSYRELTTYDSASVMHYPQCNGTGGWALNLTAKDKAGAALLYGVPGVAAAPPGAGTASTSTQTGSVAQGGSTSYGPFNAAGGTLFDVDMTGTGDADLYVGVGSAPTSSSYACRPYGSDANEHCSVSIPAAGAKVYISVRGYTAANYSLKLSYRAP